MDVLDGLDLALAHALQLDARVPFTTLGEVLGVSDQTVSRRYTALCRRGTLGITAHRRVRSLAAQWLIRLTCTPSTARSVAGSLATRPDTQWVMTTSGGTEIVCLVDAGDDRGDEFLLAGLPRTPGLLSLSAHNPLRYFVGGPIAWPGRLTALTADQQSRLRTPSPNGSARHPPDAVDEQIIDVLAQDPRVGYTTLARAAGISPGTARHRVARLRADGEVYFDVHVDPAAVGRGYICLLWATVESRALPDVGAALAGHDAIAMAAAVTGENNLLAIAVTAGPDTLYEYLTTQFAQLDDVGIAETVPVHRVVKGATEPARAGGAADRPAASRTR